jgi:uncharacterized phage protein (predicted DNA packaging)
VTVLTVEDLKAHLNVVGDDDDTLIEGKIEAAEELVAAYIGQDDLADMDPVPATVKEAVRLLVAHWYEQREAAVVGLTGGVSSTEIPFGVAELLRPHRTWGVTS